MAHARAAMGVPAGSCDVEVFVARQRWLARAGKQRVVVPFAGLIAELVPATEARMNRDFLQLLACVQTSPSPETRRLAAPSKGRSRAQSSPSRRSADSIIATNGGQHDRGWVSGKGRWPCTRCNPDRSEHGSDRARRSAGRDHDPLNREVPGVHARRSAISLRGSSGRN